MRLINMHDVGNCLDLLQVSCMLCHRIKGRFQLDFIECLESAFLRMSSKFWTWVFAFSIFRSVKTIAKKYRNAYTTVVSCICFLMYRLL